MSRRRTQPWITATLATAVLGGATLLSPAPAQALRAFHGSPDTTGIVALDCALMIVNCWLGPIDMILWGNASKCDSQPFIARVGAPFDYIGPGRKGDLYYFTNLSPGRYQLVQFRSTVMVNELPGETRTDKNDPGLRFLKYDSKGATRDFFTVDVSPGSVRYLGRLEIGEAGYQKTPCPHPFGSEPPPSVLVRVTRDSLSEVKALQALRKKARGTPWEAKLNALPDSAFHAAPVDTTWAWSY